MMPGVDRAMRGLAVASVSMMSSLRQPEEARLEVQRSGCRQVTAGHAGPGVMHLFSP